MKNTKSINPVEVAFAKWISQFPNSFHPCDRERFYSFASTIIKYKKDASKWFHKEYFVKRTKPYLEEENIDIYYKKFLDIVDYFELKPYPINRIVRYQIDENNKTTYIIEYAINDKLYVKYTDKDSFEKTKSLKRAIEFK